MGEPFEAPTSGGVSDSSGPLPAGTLLAGRYLLVRHIATGGMGEVYEARDLELDEQIALKTVRRDVLKQMRTPEMQGAVSPSGSAPAGPRGPGSSVTGATGHTYADVLHRLKREITLARRITHPNVCRLLEFGHHAASRERPPEIDVTFITMELLEGETLESRLARGAISREEARPLIRQMAEGLTAAHEAGVVHRDFKTSNVMLVPGPRGPRAVITDFGLARHELGGDGARTEAGFVVGTANYMAPEQAEGAPPTPQTDIYSLGVVLFEMVTRTIPHQGPTALATMTRRVKEPPPSPRQLVPDLEPVWESVILRCLAMSPAARFARAADVADTLEGQLKTDPRYTAPAEGSETRAVPATRPTRPPRRSALVLGLAAAVVLALAVLLATRLWPDRAQGPGAAAPGASSARSESSESSPPTASRTSSPVPSARRSVAVLSFKSQTGRPEAAWLSTALSEMLGSELSAGGEIFAVPGETVAKVRLSLSLPETDSLAPETLRGLRANLHVDYVVLGSFLLTGGQLRVDVKLQDASEGETLLTLIETGLEADLLDVVARAGAKLREKLGLRAAGARASIPLGSEPARLYAEGLTKLRALDALAARDLLEKAAAASPDHPLLRAALAETYAVLGYEAKARAEAEAALLTTSGLGREERLWVEGRAHEIRSDWARAVDSYRALFRFFPDNLEYGLRLASAEATSGQAAQALSTLALLRALPRPSSEDPRIDLAEAVAAERLSDYRRQKAAAETAIQKGRDNGARLLVGNAQLQLGTARRRMGDLEGARSAYSAARGLFDSARDRAGAARALHAEAVVLRQQGETFAAAQRYEKALSVFRDLGDQAGVAAALNDLAVLVWKKGRQSEARDQFFRSLTIRREIGDQRGVAEALNNLGDILVETGDLPAARKVYDESLALKRELDDKGGIARLLNNLAELELARGQLEQAEKLLSESAAVARGIGNRRSEAYTLHDEGELALARGDTRKARLLLEQALSIRREMGEKAVSTTSVLALAVVALRDGRPGDAEVLGAEARDGYRRLESPDGEARAEATRALALLALGKASEAQQAARKAAQLAGRTESVAVRLRVQIATARTLGGPDAPRQLEKVRAEAREKGFVLIEREAQ